MHNLELGFQYNFTAQPETGRRTVFELSCNREFPKGHVALLRNATHVDDTVEPHVLYIYGYSRDACPGIHPSPIPIVGPNHVHEEQAGYVLDLDLNHYTKTDPRTHEVIPYNVTVHDAGFAPKYYDLLYTPTENTFCPTGCDCLGDVRSAAWLCEKWSEHNPRPFCNRFGFDNVNTTKMFNPFPGFIFSGVHVLYDDNDDTYAIADWQ
jgi:hypothetical protein